MSGIDVDLAALDTIAADLDSGTRNLESAADSAPGSVDAGPMTPVIAAMLAQITDSAGNISITMSAAADTVRSARSYYRRADADAEAGLMDIQRSTEPGP